MGRPVSKRLLLRCGLLLATVATRLPAGETNAPAAAALRAIEGSLAEVKSVRTRFVQEKKLALFRSVLVTRGSILVAPPDRLLWRVDSPIRYALLVDGQQARQWDGETGKVQSLPLAGNPVFAAVTEQLRAWFGGHYSLLAKDYVITCRSEMPPVFVFTPRTNSPAAKMLRAVTVTFRDDRRYITAFQIDETGGDTTRMRFEETTLDAPLTAKDWELH